MEQLRGQDLKQAFSAATVCLEEYRDAVNALNVFPVPDGDTGTNMLLTMRSAVRSAAENCPAGEGQEHSVAQGDFGVESTRRRRGRRGNRVGVEWWNSDLGLAEI